MAAATSSYYTDAEADGSVSVRRSGRIRRLLAPTYAPPKRAAPISSEERPAKRVKNNSAPLILKAARKPAKPRKRKVTKKSKKAAEVSAPPPPKAVSNFRQAGEKNPDRINDDGTKQEDRDKSDSPPPPGPADLIIPPYGDGDETLSVGSGERAKEGDKSDDHLLGPEDPKPLLSSDGDEIPPAGSEQKVEGGEDPNPPEDLPLLSAGRFATQLNGLHNFSSACFSNAAIQLLAAALDGYDLDFLLGEVDEELERWGWTRNMCKYLDPLDPRKRVEKLRTHIKASATIDDTDAISVLKHLRDVLWDMAQPHKPKFTSAFLLQQVFAVGTTKDTPQAVERARYTGVTQEDSASYFEDLIRGACSFDGAIGSWPAPSLGYTFEIDTTRVKACTNCGHRNVANEKRIILDAVLNEEEERESIDIATLLYESTHDLANVAYMCEQSGCESQERTESIVINRWPERLVVRVNRVQYHKLGGPTKLTVPITNDGTLTIDGHNYKRLAVIYHEGPHAQTGHYTCIRHWNNDMYLLDDRWVYRIHPTDVASYIRDGGRLGYSYVYLFARVHEPAVVRGVAEDVIDPALLETNTADGEQTDGAGRTADAGDDTVSEAALSKAIAAAFAADAQR